MPALEWMEAKFVYVLCVGSTGTEGGWMSGSVLTSSCSYEVSGDAAFASLLKRTVLRTVPVAAGACDVAAATAASRPCFDTRYTCPR